MGGVDTNLAVTALAVALVAPFGVTCSAVATVLRNRGWLPKFSELCHGPVVEKDKAAILMA